jgi:hypothetical protein
MKATRIFLFFVSMILLLVAIASIWPRGPAAWMLIGIAKAVPWHTFYLFGLSGIFLYSALFEPWKYIPKSSESSDSDDWEKLNEKFYDMVSGKTVCVYYNKKTGDRRYGDGI